MSDSSNDQLAFAFVADRGTQPGPTDAPHRAPRPSRDITPPKQQGLFDPAPLPLPPTRGCCTGPDRARWRGGDPDTCLVFRCRHNLAFWVRDRDDGHEGSIKVEGGVGGGRTLRSTRWATEDRYEHLADLVVELHDRVPSLCSLDYPESVETWMDTPGRRPGPDGELQVSAAGLRELLGLRPRRMVAILAEAGDELDIAQARARRAEAAEKAKSYERRQVEAAELVQIKRKPKPCK